MHHESERITTSLEIEEMKTKLAELLDSNE
jgi:hypothetical protein